MGVRCDRDCGGGVAEFQLPGDHVLLTGCTLRPPYAIDAYARGDMDVQAK